MGFFINVSYEINGTFLMEFRQKDPIFQRLKKFPTPWGCSYACLLSNECSQASIGKAKPKILSF